MQPIMLPTTQTLVRSVPRDQWELLLNSGHGEISGKALRVPMYLGAEPVAAFVYCEHAYIPTRRIEGLEENTNIFYDQHRGWHLMTITHMVEVEDE